MKKNLRFYIEFPMLYLKVNNYQLNGKEKKLIDFRPIQVNSRLLSLTQKNV